ncbi:hypothetical protein PIB30_011651 [Stylosanthes scabra]|uniref:Uncharacterized protein n=1 Tax=Stylosanthes scabra TaxID=79078 RepID=A0ABU6X789_9FABA|nr:hypothetical protein [Stylosanthes scabra]
MPFTMKIQPIDSDVCEETRLELVKPVAKWRFKRLFERQFPGVLRSSAAVAVEKTAGDESHFGKDVAGADLEPSSVCLARMVQNFMEDNHDIKQSVSVKCSRNRCNCFNGNCDENSEGESESSLGENKQGSSGDGLEILKGLVACGSKSERNLLADTAKIVDKNKIICKRKDGDCRKLVTEGLLALGYDASICKSRWDKTPFYPAGEYEYIDVLIGNEKERVVVDVDFRSEFEIARPTKAYKAILQTVPYIFVGKSERLQSMVGIVSEAAKHSLKKKGMPVPPWRKVEYVRAKWLSPHTRVFPPSSAHQAQENQVLTGAGEFEVSGAESDECNNVVIQSKPPETKPKSSLSALAAVLNETP